jgi:hypothetical protein
VYVLEIGRTKDRFSYYRRAREEKIPAARLGKEWRFKKSIIDR